MLSRTIDILGSLAGLALFGGPMIVIAVAIRLESAGAAIFRQRRVGWRGKPFIMLKFRTMRSDADPYGQSPQTGQDPRLTRVGRLLRETSLDELPQLFHVLRGEMALVGPRPLYERQAALWNDRQRRRLEVRPGITGFAQVFGRGALTHEDKIELDVRYVETRSVWLDLRIILRTVFSALGRSDDIYEQRYSHDHQTETGAKGRQEPSLRSLGQAAAFHQASRQGECGCREPAEKASGGPCRAGSNRH